MPSSSPAGPSQGAPAAVAYSAPSSYHTPPPYSPPTSPYPPVLTTPIEPETPDETEDDGESEPPYFDLAVSTHVPLSIGGQASLELPARLLVQADVGGMPSMFGSAISGLMEDFGAYDSKIGSLVGGAFDGAVVVRLSGGWRPFPDAGFEISGGYTSISLSGSVVPADLAGVVGGEYARRAAAETLPEELSLSSQLHNFHVALGWRWIVFEHLVIRANVGYTQTLGSSSEVEIPGQSELADLANPTVDATLDEIYTSYVKLPVLGLSGGYRF